MKISKKDLKSDNIDIITYDKADKIIKVRFESLPYKY